MKCTPNNFERLVEEYNRTVKNFISSGNSRKRKSTEEWAENLRFFVERALEIWYCFAKIHDLPLYRVEFKKSLESIGESIEEEYAKPPKRAEGWAIFIDFTRSTSYFDNDIGYLENYSGYILFSAFNMFLKTYLRITGGEFLENTGDGAFIFKPLKLKSHNPLKSHNISTDILNILIAAEFLKIKAEKLGLLNFKDSRKAIIHIGIAKGKGYMIQWGCDKKFISKASWEAANNCKEAPREYDIIVNDSQVKGSERIIKYSYIYTQTPLKFLIRNYQSKMGRDTYGKLILLDRNYPNVQYILPVIIST